MTEQNYVLASGRQYQPFEQDEDQIFDDWYAAASAAAERGEPNPYGLSQEELDKIEADDEADKTGHDDDDPCDDDISDVMDDDEDYDELVHNSECNSCWGSGFRSGGDGAQCDDCSGEGYIRVGQPQVRSAISKGRLTDVQKKTESEISIVRPTRC